MRKIAIYLFAIAVVYVGLVETHRTYARAQVAKQMYANFQKNLCPPEQIDGDVCKTAPERSFCISGEYIDFRTLWGRFAEQDDAKELLIDKFAELGTLRRMGNWLSCQGFIENVDMSKARGPYYKRFYTMYYSGYGPFQRGYPILALEGVLGWSSGAISMYTYPKGQLEKLFVSGNLYLSK